jgi:hypothetical protein
MQIVQVVVPGVAFVVILGPSLSAGLESGGDLSFRAAFQPEFLVAFGHHANPFRLELNVLALILLIALRRASAPRATRSAAAASETPAV